MVEIDGAEPVTSCTTTVAEGMHVKTKSEQLDRLRRASMNFIFAGHPGDCTDCRSFGNCELQALFQYLNASVNPSMRHVTKKTNKINTVNPLIDREMERCIQCGRCVRGVRRCPGRQGAGLPEEGRRDLHRHPERPAPGRLRLPGSAAPAWSVSHRRPAGPGGVFRKDLVREEAPDSLLRRVPGSYQHPPVHPYDRRRQL